MKNCKKVRIEIFKYFNVLYSYIFNMVNITKISSKGQVVIPSEIRERMNLEEEYLIKYSEEFGQFGVHRLRVSVE